MSDKEMLILNCIFYFLEIACLLYFVWCFIKYKKVGKERINAVDKSKKEKEKRLYILTLVIFVVAYIGMFLCLLYLFKKNNQITNIIAIVCMIIFGILYLFIFYTRRREKYSNDRVVFWEIYKYEYLPNAQLKKGEVVNIDEFIPNAIKLALCKEHAFKHADTTILQFINTEERKYKIIESVFKVTNENIEKIDILERGRHILYICGFKGALLKYIEVFKEELTESISEDEMNKINAMEDDGLLDIEVNR